jgi:hypothetical protein
MKDPSIGNVEALLRWKAEDPGREFLDRLEGRLRWEQRRPVGGLLPAGVIAAALLIGLLLWVAKTSGDGQGGPSRGAAMPRWGWPVEIFSCSHSEGKEPRVYQPFRTESGILGLFGYASAEGADAVWLSQEGQGPWTKVPLPMHWPSAVRIQGNSLSYVVTAGRGARFVRFDLQERRETRSVVLPGKVRGMVSATVWSEGPEWIALLAGMSGLDGLLFARSTDDGATWSELQEINPASGPPSGGRPILLSTKEALHAIYLANSYERAAGLTLVHKVSFNRGRTWSDRAVPPLGSPDRNAGFMTFLDGATTANRLHLVSMQSGGAQRTWIIDWTSEDEGATWKENKRFEPYPGPFRTRNECLRLQARGATIALAFTDSNARGPGICYPRLFVSRDRGETWAEEPVADGVRGVAGLSPVWIDPDGSLWAGLVASREESAEWRSSALLRAWRVPTPTPALDRNAAKRVGDLVELLGSEDIERRAEASRDLLRMGEGIAPLLQEWRGQSRTPEIKLRIAEVLQQLGRAWPDPAHPPPWWGEWAPQRP